MLKQMSQQDYLLDFVSWVNDQPDDRIYNYTDTQHCAVGQYMQERLGLERLSPEYALAWSGTFDQRHPIVLATHWSGNGFLWAIQGAAILYAQQTFGDLKRRLAKLAFVGA